MVPETYQQPSRKVIFSKPSVHDFSIGVSASQYMVLVPEKRNKAFSLRSFLCVRVGARFHFPTERRLRQDVSKKKPE
jgi:hypothetical protein